MGRRKGIWLGADDLWLLEEAKKEGRAFSDFAKYAMRVYCKSRGSLTPGAIAEAVVALMMERGLVMQARNGMEDEIQEDVSGILEKAASQFL